MLLESCAAFPQSISKLIKPLTNLSFSLTRFKCFNKLQTSALHLPSNEYESYNQEIKNMSKQTLINILIANTTFNVKSFIPINFQGKTFIVYGTKEKRIIVKSSHYLAKKLANAKIIPLKNYHHGELTLKHPLKFSNIINMLKDTCKKESSKV